VTLVEMLIVISIIVILTVASLKLITPAEDRRVHEAARAVNVYISSARSRAIEIGRPCGVIFRRTNIGNFPTASTILDQCEVPPTFAGDTTDAVVKVQDWTYRSDAWTDLLGNNHPWPYWDNDKSKTPPILKTRVLKVWVRTGDFSNNVVRRGDLVQLGGQGPYYTIVEDPDSGPNFRRTVPVLPAMPPPLPFPSDFPLDANGYIDFSKGVDNSTPLDGWIDNYILTLAMDANMLQASPWPTFVSGGVPNTISFNIMRQPMKSAAAPLQLPAGSVVDLDFSGTDNQTFQNPSGNYYDVAVIFSPNGSVEGYYWNNQPYPALGPIFMLVGSRSRVRDFSVIGQPLPATPNLNDLPNWADLSSIWITINYQTGMAVSDENYAINFATVKDTNIIPNQLIPWDKMIGPAPGYYPNWAYFINLSRNYARQSQSMGGR
jgi:type II secretory pathway pseudopilin PulG